MGEYINLREVGWQGVEWILVAVNRNQYSNYMCKLLLHEVSQSRVLQVLYTSSSVN